MAVPRKYDVHCKYSGKGCAKEDSCYLGRVKASLECSYHVYFDFISRLDEQLSACLEPTEGSRLGCKDLNIAGECMDTDVFCVLMDYQP